MIPEIAVDIAGLYATAHGSAGAHECLQHDWTAAAAAQDCADGTLTDLSLHCQKGFYPACP